MRRSFIHTNIKRLIVVAKNMFKFLQVLTWSPDLDRSYELSAHIVDDNGLIPCKLNPNIS